MRFLEDALGKPTAAAPAERNGHPREAALPAGTQDGETEMAAANLDPFWALIEKIEICMMTTRDSNALRARPMVP